MLDDLVYGHIIVFSTLVNIDGGVIVQELDLVAEVGQVTQSIGVVGQLSRIAILNTHVDIRGHHVGVHRDGIAGNEAVEVALGGLGVTVLVHVVVLDDGVLVIQGPLALLHGLVQIGDLVLLKQGLVVQGQVHEAEHGDGDGTGDKELHVLVGEGHHVVVALGPVVLGGINVLQRGEVDVLTLHGGLDRHIGTVGHQIVVTETALDIEIHHAVDVGFRVHLQDHTQHLLNGYVALVDSIGHHSVTQLLRTELVPPIVDVGVEETNGGLLVIQVGGQIAGVVGIGGLDLVLGTLILGLVGGGIVGVLTASHEAQKHEGGQKQAQKLLHTVSPS